MEDSEIIELYFSRDENSIAETKKKYGSILFKIAFNILGIKEDCEETLSDTYLTLWNTIPPTRPLSLKAYLCRISRNLAINAYNKSHAKCRDSNMETLLSELSDCVPSDDSIEKETDTREISAAINTFLEKLNEHDRILFVRRYFYCESLNELSKVCGISQKKLAALMFSLRKGLKKELIAEGVTL